MVARYEEDKSNIGSAVHQRSFWTGNINLLLVYLKLAAAPLAFRGFILEGIWKGRKNLTRLIYNDKIA